MVCIQPVISLHDLPFTALEAMLVDSGLRPIHTRPLWRALHRDLCPNPGTLAKRSDFSPPLRRWIAAHLQTGHNEDIGYVIEQPEVVGDIDSTDGLTRKFLLRLADTANP